ncbi:MAG: FHIPEP family type III secretion protein [Planctomycetota bacterium]
MTGLLLPLPTHVLDVLLIFNLSLTAAVLIITFSAQQALQVQSFPLLIVLVTALRMALTAACAKLALLQGNAGTIVRILGQVVVNGNLMFTVSVFGMLVTVIFGIVCKSVKGISQAGAEFVSDVVPARQTIIDSDLNEGVINESQALNLRTTIARERSFFVKMTGAAKFILCSAVIELVIVLLTVAASIGMGVAATTSIEAPAKAYTSLALGAGTATQISLLIIALGSAHLVRKSFVLPASPDRSAEPQVPERERIRVAAEEVPPSLKPQVKFESILIPAKGAAMVESKFVDRELAEIDNAADTDINSERNESTTAESTGHSDTSQNSGINKTTDDSARWTWRQVRDNNCYESIADLIRSKSTDHIKTVLMAAENIAELPVTVPVNIALCLARKERRCLLVDLDSARDAVAKVFEVDGKGPEGKHGTLGRPSCISNLSILPASDFGKCEKEGDRSKLKDTLTLAKATYDHIILYAPHVQSLIQSQEVANSMDTAILFGRATDEAENPYLSDLHKLLITSGREVIKPADIFGGTVQ